MSQSFIDKLMHNGCIFNVNPADGINIKIADKSSIQAVGSELEMQIHGISYTQISSSWKLIITVRSNSWV
jgi:hypothetical protein